MTAHTAPDHGPFTVIMCDTGASVVYRSLEDATRYMARQLAYDRTSACFDKHGQIIAANEIQGAFQRLFGQDGAA